MQMCLWEISSLCVLCLTWVRGTYSSRAERGRPLKHIFQFFIFGFCLRCWPHLLKYIFSMLCVFYCVKLRCQDLCGKSPVHVHMTWCTPRAFTYNCLHPDVYIHPLNAPNLSSYCGLSIASVSSGGGWRWCWWVGGYRGYSRFVGCTLCQVKAVS